MLRQEAPLGEPGSASLDSQRGKKEHGGDSLMAKVLANRYEPWFKSQENGEYPHTVDFVCLFVLLFKTEFLCVA